MIKNVCLFVHSFPLLVDVENHGVELHIRALRRVFVGVFNDLVLLVNVVYIDDLHPDIRKRVGVVEALVREVNIVVLVQIHVACIVLAIADKSCMQVKCAVLGVVEKQQHLA